MNIDISDLFKRTASLFVVLGVILILLAAITALPFGAQNSISLEPSWRYIVAVIGGILLACGIFLTLQELRLSNLKSSKGGRGVIFSREFPPTLISDFESAKDIWIIGATLGNTIRRNYKTLEGKLQQGHSIKVLLVRPEGASLEMLATRYCAPINRIPDTQSARIREVLQNFIQLKEIAPNRVQIRIVNYPLSFGATAINPNSDSGVLYLEHYPFRTESAAVPKFVLRASDGDWYAFFFKEIQALWDNSTEWNS